MTDYLNSLLARNAPTPTETLLALLPRLRSRFEPSDLAVGPSLGWEAESAVERETLPVELSAYQASSQTTPERVVTAHPPPPFSAPDEPRLAENDFARRMARLAERLRGETQTQPAPKLDTGHPAPPTRVAPEGRIASGTLAPSGTDNVAPTRERTASRDPTPWTVQPQAVRVEPPQARPRAGPEAVPLAHALPVPPPAPPPIQVTIGRLEVRAVTSNRATRSTPKPRSGQSLREYLSRSAKR
jgi:hypothetical protein